MQKRWLLTLVACVVSLVALFSGITATAQQSQSSGAVFRTPEEAITSFFEGVAQGDFAKILQSCAIAEISENFKFDLFIDRIRAFVPYQSFAPTNYPFYVELNKAEITARISNQVKIFAFSLLFSGDIAFDRTNLMDIDGARAFAADVDPSRLAQLELIQIAPPSPAMLNTERYKNNALRIAATFGADDSTERLALFSFEGNDYVLGFTLLRYGDTWKINSANSAIAGTSSLGTPEQVTLEQFAEMTS